MRLPKLVEEGYLTYCNHSHGEGTMLSSGGGGVGDGRGTTDTVAAKITAKKTVNYPVKAKLCSLATLKLLIGLGALSPSAAPDSTLPSAA